MMFILLNPLTFCGEISLQIAELFNIVCRDWFCFIQFYDEVYICLVWITKKGQMLPISWWYGVKFTQSVFLCYLKSFLLLHALKYVLTCTFRNTTLFRMVLMSGFHMIVLLLMGNMLVPEFISRCGLMSGR